MNYTGPTKQKARHCANSPGSADTYSGGIDMANTTCSINGCESPSKVRGWCSKHYQRWQKHGHPEAGATYKGDARRFAEQAANHVGAECLPWPFCTGPLGYGRVNVDGKTKRVHRYVLELATGKSPKGMVAAHAPMICHNPSCVNPGHLRWATQADNLSDMKLDGTDAHVEHRSTTKLTPEQVLEIVADDRLQAVIASEYGVSPSHVSAIKSGTFWSRVTGIKS